MDLDATAASMKTAPTTPTSGSKKKKKSKSKSAGAASPIRDMVENLQLIETPSFSQNATGVEPLPKTPLTHKHGEMLRDHARHQRRVLRPDFSPVCTRSRSKRARMENQEPQQPLTFTVNSKTEGARTRLDFPNHSQMITNNGMICPYFYFRRILAWQIIKMILD